MKAEADESMPTNVPLTTPQGRNKPTTILNTKKSMPANLMAGKAPQKEFFNK